MSAKQNLHARKYRSINTKNSEEQYDKPPFLQSNKKLSATDGELDAYYLSLCEYYFNLPYNRMKVSQQEVKYRTIARIARLFSTLRNTVVLNEKRVVSHHHTIYTANHIGSFDQFYITKLLGYTPLHYLVNEKVTTWPIRWNLIYKPTGVVVVNQQSMASWRDAKTKLTQYLLHGGNVFIFAEGSRRGEDNVGKFSSGIAQIAQETGCNVCTLALKNTSKVFTSKVPFVCVGETFTVGLREDIREATERIKTSVLSAYDEILAYESGCYPKGP